MDSLYSRSEPPRFEGQPGYQVYECQRCGNQRGSTTPIKCCGQPMKVLDVRR